MPSIDITPAQAARLADGLPITITPPAKQMIAVDKDTGDVYEYKRVGGKNKPWTKVHRGRGGAFEAGYKSPIGFEFKDWDHYVVVEVNG